MILGKIVDNCNIYRVLNHLYYSYKFKSADTVVKNGIKRHVHSTLAMNYTETAFKITSYRPDTAQISPTYC